MALSDLLGFFEPPDALIAADHYQSLRRLPRRCRSHSCASNCGWVELGPSVASVNWLELDLLLHRVGYGQSPLAREFTVWQALEADCDLVTNTSLKERAVPSTLDERQSLQALY